MDQFGSVLVGVRPLIIVKGVVEDLWVEEIFKIGAFLDQEDEVVLKEVGVDVWVLVLYHVSDDHIHRSDLVFPNALVNRWLTVLLFEEDREFIVEVRVIFLGKQKAYRFDVKCHKRDQILVSQLKENFEEDRRIRLHFDKRRNFAWSFASIYALDQHKFSKSAFMDLNFVHTIEFGLTWHVVILILDLDLSIFVELEIKFNVALILYFEVVARS